MSESSHNGVSKSGDDEEGHTHYHGVDRAEQHIGVDEALRILLEEIDPVKSEVVSLSNALNRILSEDLRSDFDIPKLSRSTRDGYAVKFNESMASVENPTFEVVGDVSIGTLPRVSIKDGQGVRISTGSYLPESANSVVMKEYAELEGNNLRVNRPAKMWENILRPGEDIAKGEVVLKMGTRLYPHHIALLSLLGKIRIKVFRKPRVAFFSTGDELTDAGKKSDRKSARSKIFDSNRPFIHSMLSKLGADPIDLGIAPDNEKRIRAKMLKGLNEDALLLSAGSSVGERDYVTLAASSIDGARILIHGVAMRPSSPTGLAVYKRKPFILLPGFPTSAMVSFFVFGIPAIMKLSGLSDFNLPLIRAKLLESYKGKTGIRQYIRVKVSQKEGEYFATIARPTEAQYSSWMKNANGIAVIDETQDTLEPNEEVRVFLIGDIISEN